MTAGHLTIRVGDRAYGLTGSRSQALAYFGRAYAACLGHPSEESACFALEQRGSAWHGLCDGDEFTRGALSDVTRLVDWELTRRAVKRDSTCAAFHAAWAALGSRAVMLAGDGGAGKSRLCLQLVGEGLRCGAEDVTFVDDGRLIPFPRAVQIRRDDPVLHEVEPERIFPGLDGRMCVAVEPGEAADPTPAMMVAFLDPSAGAGTARRLAPLAALERLFRLCHRLDRVTGPVFASFVELAVAGRMYVLPRDPLAAILALVEADDD